MGKYIQNSFVEWLTRLNVPVTLQIFQGSYCGISQFLCRTFHINFLFRFSWVFTNLRQVMILGFGKKRFNLNQII